MHSAFTPVIRFLVRTLQSLLVIAVILAGGRFLLDQGRVLRSSSQDLQALTSAHGGVMAYRAAVIAQARARMTQARRESLAAIDARIAQTTVALRAYERRRDASVLTLAGADHLAGRLRNHAESAVLAEVTRQELQHLLVLRTALTAEVEGLRKAHVERYAALTRLKDAYAHPGPVELAKRLIGTSTQGAELAAARAANAAAFAAFDQARARVQRDGAAINPAAFLVDERALDAAVREITGSLEQARVAVADNWFARYVTPVIEVLPVALAVLLSSFAAHFCIKIVFYFVLAPLAARRKPIQLEPEPAVHGVRASASAVSHDIHLAPGEELLILPEFLQSASTAARKDTKLMLDWSCPWTSLVSGMVMLTRVRTSSRDDYVVVSSDTDAVSELALVTIPAGAAMVFQPHGLVGVVHPAEHPLKITRRWRLFSAHAWLTLQLRYLIFRGPVTLIVKGTRGVRVEPAGQGRMISQFATLGFSSHLHYATVRSETFLAYYQNRTALLQDKFEGESGYYVYDETPRFGKSGGFFSRGLEGVTDALLKVFGI